MHIMLDLETWGKKPGADIRSIGACVFAPFTRHGGSLIHDGSLGTIKPFYVACDNPIIPEDRLDQMDVNGPVAFSYMMEPHLDETTGKFGEYREYRLKRDPETVAWWNDPERANAATAFADPIDLKEALQQFSRWLLDIAPHETNVPSPWPSPDIKLWSHGPAFDVAILAAAYDAVGLPVPWHYRAPRDTRTCFDMAGIEDHSAFMAQYNTGTLHHALDDAISQAKAVCAAMAITIDWRAGYNEAMGRRSPENCPLPPKGWYCTREVGHPGPCAARPMIHMDDGK